MTRSSLMMEDPLAKEALNFLPKGKASTCNLLAVLGDMNECELPKSMRKDRGLPS